MRQCVGEVQPFLRQANRIGEGTAAGNDDHRRRGCRDDLQPATQIWRALQAATEFNDPGP